jgi:hypothetical protein
MRPADGGDDRSGMNVVRRGRGNALLLAHCASLDPEVETAKERLEDALGPELAHRLVHALTAGAPTRPEAGLRPRTVFAA